VPVALQGRTKAGEMSIRVDVLIGGTACGKGAVGRYVARQIGAEIISIDSMKVYRRMDIGTAKPPPQARAAIPHHLIDVVEPWEEFSVARYLQLADAAIRDIAARGRRILAVGGTALYIKALTEGLFEGPGADHAFRAQIRRRAAEQGLPALHAELARIDPEAARRIHPNDLRRIERALEVYHLTGTPISQLQRQWGRSRPGYEFRLVGLRRSKEDQNHRINMRVRRMMEAGWLEEVRSLLALPHPLSRQARQALGYAELIAYLTGRISLADAIEQIKINTRRFAKSQRTWYRRFRDVRWIDVTPDEPVEHTAEKVLQLLE